MKIHHATRSCPFLPTSETHGISIDFPSHLVAVGFHLRRSQGRLGAHGQLPEGAFPGAKRAEISRGNSMVFWAAKRIFSNIFWG